MREKDILGETDIGRHKRRLVPMPCHSKFHHQSCSPTLRNGIYLRNQKKTQNETVLKKQVKYNYKYNMNKVNMNTILTKPVHSANLKIEPIVGYFFIFSKW